MPAAKAAVSTTKLAPSAAESSTPSGVKRLRLSKVLAALPTEKSARKHLSGKQPKPDEAGPKKLKLKSKRYTIADNEYAQLAALKKRLLTLGVDAKKSQLLRAGLLLLAAMSDTRLKTAVAKAQLALPLPPKVTDVA